MIWVGPAFRDHALGRKIDHVGRPFTPQQIDDRGKIVIEIEPVKTKALVVARPAVGQEGAMGLGRAAYPDDRRLLGKQIVAEARA